MASVLQGDGDAGGNPRKRDNDKFNAGKQQKQSKIAKRVARNSLQTPTVAATNGGANPSSPSHNPIDALVTSRFYSGQNHCSEPVNAEEVPVYTRFENRVRINLNSRSRFGIKELTTKLKGELDQVRSLVKKFETQELQLSGYGGDVGHSQSQFSANNLVERVGTVSTMKVNSEVGSADVPASRLVRCASVAENFGEFAQPYRYASKLNANTGNYTGLRTGLSPCKHATNKPCGPYLGWRHVSTPTGLGLSCALATDKKTNQQFVNCRQGCTRLGHQRSR